MNNTSKKNNDWQLLVSLLSELAKQKGISHQAIADASGLKRSNVSRVFSLNYAPNLTTFLSIARAVGVNFYFEDKASDSDLNAAFERAMESLGRRTEKLPKN